MRRASILVVFVLLLAVAAEAGEIARSGSWGIQTSLGVATATGPGASTIGAKFFVSHNAAIRLEAGVTVISPPGGGSTTGYAFGGGFEYHWPPVGSVTPYIGLEAGYGSASLSGGGSSPYVIGARAVAGGEYFFSSNFSGAGEIGLGFASTNPGGAGSQSTNTFGTTGASLILTWYFN
jgi:hypothetical protein